MELPPPSRFAETPTTRFASGTMSPKYDIHFL